MPLRIYSTSFQLFIYLFIFLFLREILATCQITEKEPPTELVLLPHQETCSNFVYPWEELKSP